MELSAGYQLTELGLIRNDWKISQVQDVCRLVNGRGFKPFEWSTQGLPIIRIQNLNGSGDFNFYNGDYDKKIEILTGQLLFAWSGSRGTSFGPHFWSGTKGVLNYHTWKVVVDEQAVDSKFFFYALKKLTEFIEERAHGASALVHTQKWEMETFKFPMPSDLNEQRAIAKSLSDVDALIAGLEKLIAKKRDLKQAAMQQLLTGQTRLPGFSGEWLYAPIHELEVRGLLKLSRGNVISKSDITSTPGEYPIYSSSIHNNGEFGRYGKYMFDEELITWSVDGGGNFFYRPAHKFSVTNVCGFMRGKTESLNHRFLAYQLQQQHSQKSFDYQTKAHPSVVRAEYVVAVPSLDEQTSIANLLSNMDFEIEKLGSRLAKTRELKQGMMQELLTGRTRLVLAQSKATTCQRI